jgi:transcriptional regulator with AAA-type ATPase domain
MPQRKDPVFDIIGAGLSLRAGRYDEALDSLFRAASSPQLPAPWAKGLKTLTKQVRRFTARMHSAEAARVEGNAGEMRRHLDMAADILKDAPKGLTVEYTGPTLVGREDLAESVLECARERLRNARGRR